MIYYSDTEVDLENSRTSRTSSNISIDTISDGNHYITTSDDETTYESSYTSDYVFYGKCKLCLQYRKMKINCVLCDFIINHLKKYYVD